MRRRLALTFCLTVLLALMLVMRAEAHYKPGRHNAVHAVQLVWCGKANHACYESERALSVVRCEAAQYWTWNIPRLARNGQYRGMFQMGKWERDTFGHGPDPWAQARAAHKYWRIEGWSPWECKP